MKLPKIPTPKLSENAKLRVTRVYALFSAIMYRLVPIIIFGLIFAQIAVLLDQNHYRNAQATEFLNYTEFTVQNARENEDVYFRVCRDHISNIRYDGDLSIYIIANADQPDSRRVQVYSRDIGGTITNDCENKVIRASDFKHEVGTYEMGFYVRFKVKYGFEKEVCKNSNRYRIYAQPSDLDSRIRDLEQQLESARQQLRESSGNINQPQDNSLAVPRPQVQPQNQQNTGNAGNNNSGGNTGGNGNGSTGTGVQPPTCALNIGALGVVCGSDGLLRL